MPVPVSTYRVQIRPGFDLAATAELVGYLADLGVTHLYASPLVQAAPASQHGYDVVDPDRVDHERGGEPGLRRLRAALSAHGLGLVADIVPNHVGVQVPPANPAWWDVLRHGPTSRFAHWFDIDWSATGTVVLPVLDDSPDALALLRVEDGELRYRRHRFPIAPGTGDGDPRAVHDRQHYRLVPWRRGDAEVNYRRFFAVSGLAALRVEDPRVFEATHRLVLDWAATGVLDGIRVDHPDGLADPTGYLAALDRRTPPGTWVVVEKILAGGETLPAGWACAGTTGYDALREVCGLFVDPAAEPALTGLDREVTGAAADWPALSHSCRRAVATGILRAELRRMVALAPEIDPDPGTVADALAEILACFEVYRTYLPEGTGYLERAGSAAVRSRPELAGPVAALVARLADPRDPLAVRFQQTSGAVMAKGVEDTAFYRYTRFTALNEVGGDPSRFGVDPREFHAACAARQRHRPAGMTTLSSHDTKRSEDVRARLAVLSELPGEWAEAVRDWARAAPCGAFAHLLWQTAVGTWPIEAERLHAYCEKAMREAGDHTGWADPEPGYEAAVHQAVDRLYDGGGLAARVAAFATRITPYGWVNSLGQKLVQLTMPGVPDVYQGTELWDNSLVDPDNRRPVDFTARRALLARLDRTSGGGLAVPPVDRTAAAKLLVVSRAARLRRDRPEAFVSYTPLPARGTGADHALAFDRGEAITVVTRLPVGLERVGGWWDTSLPLPPGRWRDVLTGASHPGGAAVPVADLLARLPVALLHRVGI
ncbi:MAG TPA: malto-oligosyltrehalose synthase [Mycobacteriales bacterium]|nr:malto-oligosyltrehalose synthase [Mycobacteriales bacterium]